MKKLKIVFLITALLCVFTAISACEQEHTHVIKRMPESVSTCAKQGNCEYWFCEICNAYFSDAEGTNEIADKNSVLLPLSTVHESITHHEPQSASCTLNGNTEYYECTVCEKYFSDSEATDVIADKSSVIIAKTAHDLTHHDKKDETCTENGNTEYWECSTCQNFFSDKDGKNLIADKSQVTITAKHLMSDEWTKTSSTHYHKCTRCDYKEDESAHNFNSEKVCTVCSYEHKYTEGLTYSFNDDDMTGTVTGIGTTTGVTELIIPQEVDGYAITAIGENAFSENTTIEKLVLPEGIKIIDAYAFKNCSNITQIDFPSSLESIKKYAFASCTSLKTLELKEGTKYIGHSAFSKCTALNEVILPDSLDSLSMDMARTVGVFYGCSAITKMTLPFIGTGVKQSGFTTFGTMFGTDSATGMTSVKQYYYSSSTSTALSNKTFYIPSNLKEITVTGDYIGSGAFYGLHVEKITIKNAKTIEGLAFYNLTCEYLYLPDTITSMSTKKTFDTGSYSIDIYTPYSEIPKSWGTDLPKHIYLNCVGLFTENNYFFAKYKNDTATILKYLSSDTSELVVPEKLQNAFVTAIGSDAFSQCQATKVTLPNTVTELFDYAFTSSKTSEVVLSNSLKKIGNYAFYQSDLETIVIFEGLESIGYHAFAYSEITALDIPNSVTSIDERILEDCLKLETLVLPYLGENANASNKTLTYYFGTDVKIKHVTVKSGEISEKAFSNFKSLVSVTLPQGITSIPKEAFSNCSALESVNIPTTVKSIGNNAFYQCSALKSINIPESVEKIGEKVFYKCTSLKNAIVLSSTSELNIYVFYKCTSLEYVVLSADITLIQETTFQECSSLSAVYYTGTEQQWNTLLSNLYYNTDPVYGATVYYYSDTAVTGGWHYENDIPTPYNV